MRGLNLLLVAMVATTAVALSVRGTALAQQGPQLFSVRVAEVPMDPRSPIWQQAPAAEVPLIPQAAALPRLLEVSVSSVSVRSLNDGERIAFRLEWVDETRDARAARPDEFRDAAAVLFGVNDGLPNVCMGLAGEPTNLWHWKADWQEDINLGFQDVVDAYPNFYMDTYPFATGEPPFRAPEDFGSAEAQQYLVALAAGNPLAVPDRSSPVEELLSEGFGTVVHKDQQAVDGHGVWSEGRWQVVFSRSLESDDAYAPDLSRHSEVPTAFAVWNGSNQEVGGRKQLSGFVTLQIAGQGRAELLPSGTAVWELAVPTGLALILGIVALAAWTARRREEARAGASVQPGAGVR